MEYDDYTIDELRSWYSDVYKDLTGFRPDTRMNASKQDFWDAIKSAQKELNDALQRELDEARKHEAAVTKAMTVAPSFTLAQLGLL